MTSPLKERVFNLEMNGMGEPPPALAEFWNLSNDLIRKPTMKDKVVH